MRRKEAEQQWRRQYILNVAEKIFAQKGFHNTTMAEIAKAADFGMATIYQFFKSKEKIYATIFNEKLETLINQVKRAIKHEKNPIAKLKAVLRTNFEFFKEHQHFFRLYSMEKQAIAVILREDLGKGIYQKHQEGISIIAAIIEEGIKQGIFRSFPSKDIAILLLGMLEEYINDCLKEPDVNWEEKLKIITEVFFKGVLEVF